MTRLNINPTRTLDISELRTSESIDIVERSAHIFVRKERPRAYVSECSLLLFLHLHLIAYHIATKQNTTQHSSPFQFAKMTLLTCTAAELRGGQTSDLHAYWLSSRASMRAGQRTCSRGKAPPIIQVKICHGTSAAETSRYPARNLGKQGRSSRLLDVHFVGRGARRAGWLSCELSCC